MLIEAAMLEREQTVAGTRTAGSDRHDLGFHVHGVARKKRMRKTNVFEAEVRHGRAERGLVNRDANEEPERRNY